MKTSIMSELSTRGMRVTRVYSRLTPRVPDEALNLPIKKLEKAIRKGVRRGVKWAVRGVAQEAELNLKWIIANYHFYGYAFPMYFSGKLWQETRAKKLTNTEWVIETTEYGATLMDGRPPGTIVPETEYTRLWARIKMNAPFWKMRRVIEKKGVKPRRWIELGELMTFPKTIEIVEEILEKTIERELRKAIAEVR